MQGLQQTTRNSMRCSLPTFLTPTMRAGISIGPDGHALTWVGGVLGRLLQLTGFALLDAKAL